MRVAIIGAGAAGCFCAINIKKMMTSAIVDVYEAGTKALAKVAVTGGGRCNLTNSFRLVDNIAQVYPRGDKLMRRALKEFSNEDAMEWFEREGVRLVVQDDECVFPQSQNAMEIVDTFLRLMQRNNIRLILRTRDIIINKVCSGDGDSADTSYTVNGEHYDKVVVAIGGCVKRSKLDFLSSFNLDIVEPVPSLFTFNIAGDWHQKLMGTVVENATVMLAGTKFRSNGALLLTHWGMSGPAILKLSSYAARHLAEHDYKGHITVNWCGDDNEEDVRAVIRSMMEENAAKLVTNVYPRHLSQAHWQVLLQRAGVPHTARWGALNKKNVNRLASVLTADVYEITGRCPFKEEFVTAGGVALSNINPKTMEAKKHPNLYFIGEVLDVDAITGGFNLQAAWSMAMLAARGMCF